MTDFVLVHSPLVGPTTWQPVADVLQRRGHDAAVPTWEPGRPGHPPWRGAAASAATAAATVMAGGRLVLVGHSRAGAVLPVVAERLAAADRPVAAILFVDAVLPPVIGDPAPTPSPFDAFVDSLPVVDGLLPPWPEWWPVGTMEALVPDPEVRAAVEVECPSVMRGVLQENHGVPKGWPDPTPAGFLSFTYEDEALEAERRGWVVGRADGTHLQAVVDPEGVADLLLLMVAGLGLRP